MFCHRLSISQDTADRFNLPLSLSHILDPEGTDSYVTLAPFQTRKRSNKIKPLSSKSKDISGASALHHFILCRMSLDAITGLTSYATYAMDLSQKIIYLQLCL